MESSLTAATQVAEQLRERELKIVFAESCTAGRLCAILGQHPGISSFLCGGFVVYRNASKSTWLDIDERLLSDPDVGPVSPQVTRLLADSALKHTPESDLAVAITGDIGPGVSEEKDGLVFCCVKLRTLPAFESSTKLKLPPPMNSQDIRGRIDRLDETSQFAFDFLAQCLKACSS